MASRTVESIARTVNRFKDDEGINVTVHFKLVLAKMKELYLADTWLQQDGVTCHTSRETIGRQGQYLRINSWDEIEPSVRTIWGTAAVNIYILRMINKFHPIHVQNHVEVVRGYWLLSANISNRRPLHTPEIFVLNFNMFG